MNLTSYNQDLLSVFTEAQSYQKAQDLTFLLYVRFCQAADLKGCEIASYMQLSEAGYYERLAAIRARLKKEEPKWLTKLRSLFLPDKAVRQPEVESKIPPLTDAAPLDWRPSALVKMAVYLGHFIRLKTCGHLKRTGCRFEWICDQLALSVAKGQSLTLADVHEWISTRTEKEVDTDVVQACIRRMVEGGYFVVRSDEAIVRTKAVFSYDYHCVEKRSLEFLGSPGVTTSEGYSFLLSHREFNKMKSLLDSRDERYFPAFSTLTRLDEESSVPLGHDGALSNYGFLIVVYRADLGESFYPYPNATLIAGLNNYDPSCCFARPVTGTLTEDCMKEFEAAFPSIKSTHLSQFDQSSKRSVTSGDSAAEYRVYFAYGRLA